MDETNATAQEVRGTLEAVQSAIESLGSSNSESRIMLTVYFTLVTKFTGLLSECVVYNCNLFNPQSVATVAVGSVLLGLMRCRYIQMQENAQIHKDLDATKVLASVIRPSHNKLLADAFA